MPCDGRDERWRDGDRLVCPGGAGRPAADEDIHAARGRGPDEVHGGVAEASSVADVEIVLIERDIDAQTGSTGRIEDPIDEVEGQPEGVDAEGMRRTSGS